MGGGGEAGERGALGVKEERAWRERGKWREGKGTHFFIPRFNPVSFVQSLSTYIEDISHALHHFDNV